MKIKILILLISLSLFSNFCIAESKYDKAHSAISFILFDYDNVNEFITFKIRNSGYIDLSFANNIPDDLFLEIIQKLKKHPDVKGVLAGRGGPTCSLWR